MRLRLRAHASRPISGEWVIELEDIGRLALALSLSLSLSLSLTRNPNANLEDIGGLDVEMAEVESVHLLERRADGLDHRRYPCALELVRVG